jgi:hypothetical protein
MALVCERCKGYDFGMNPYASFLGTSNPVQVIAATPTRLQELASELGPQGVERVPAPGKWNGRQIMCHLADCEVVFAFRLRQALAQENHVIQPFDQDSWAKSYGAYSASDALALFSAARLWNCTLINSLDAEDLARQVTHPERGTMTVRTIVETMAGHDLNHIRQIEKLSVQAA